MLINYQQILAYNLQYLSILYNYIHMNNAISILIIFLTTLTCLNATDCQEQNYIIPFAAIDSVFDQGIDAVRSQQNLIALIEDPNQQTLTNYVLSLLPYSAPLFVMAGITFVIFIATIVQVICFNTCGKQCCGNQLTSSTYNICCMRAMTIFFILFSFLTMCLCIAALIVNSDLQRAIDYTSCNTINIINQTYQGNDNVSMPWSGIKTFDADIEDFSNNIQNTLPYLVQYFSDANPEFKNVTNKTAGSAYQLSQQFNCPTSTLANLTCPFDPSVQNCSDPYEPLFYVQFCDIDVSTSALSLITKERAQNSTKWEANLEQLSITLGNLKTQKSTLDQLVEQVNSFTGSLIGFQTNLQDGFSNADNINYNLEIAFYVFYSFLLLCALVSITTVCCTYYCNNFNCKCWTYVFWYTFFFFALILFILAGLFLAGSILTFDSCTAYPYYFNNEANFQNLNFSNNQIGGIFQTCFFTNATSIFKAFNETSVLGDFQQMRVEYAAATPAVNFSSVVTSIQNTLYGYALDPATITINGVQNPDQPSTALKQFNTFANASNPSSTQGCSSNPVNYKVVFDPINCAPEVINLPIGQDSCFVLNDAYDFQNKTDSVYNHLLDGPCSQAAQTWRQSSEALYDYGNSALNLVLSLAPIQPTTVAPQGNLQQYQSNYYNYYAMVNNFLNGNIKTLFGSFFNPYDSLTEQSSCTYVTYSMNGIIDIACNQLFPYFNALSVLNIIISVFVFIMMILSYFLTTRYQFYEFLQGNFQNYGVETFKTNQLPGYTMDSTRDKNIELMDGGSRY